jgi:hypothetical protein
MIAFQDRQILDLFATRVREHFPEARIWAFGSRARGDATWESDLGPCPPSPRDICLRGSPRHRGLIDDGRAAAASSSRCSCAIPFAIVPSQLLHTGRCEALAPGKPLRRSRHPASAVCPGRVGPHHAVRRAAAVGCRRRLGTPPAPRARGSRWRGARGGPPGSFRGCPPKGPGLKCVLIFPRK